MVVSSTCVRWRNGSPEVPIPFRGLWRELKQPALGEMSLL